MLSRHVSRGSMIRGMQTQGVHETTQVNVKMERVSKRDQEVADLTRQITVILQLPEFAIDSGQSELLSRTCS